MDAMSTAEDSLRPDVNITAPSEKTAARARLFTPPVTAAVSGFELRFPKIGNWLEPPSSLYQPAPMVSSSPGPFPDDSSSLTALDHTSAPDADDDGAPKTTSPYGQLRLGQPKIPTPDPVTGVFGASYVDAIVHILPPYWKPPMGDTPFPAPGKESQLVVRRLRDALLNTNNTKDNKNNIYNAHWTPGMSKMFLEWQADRVCWEILNETFKLHEHGFVAPIFDREPDKHVDKDLTFSQRINQLVKLLSVRKELKSCYTDANVALRTGSPSVILS
ncbi:hypothetical protein BDV96DRAFT_349956 [Lophiotrema nucula]|uniref:Uncharacterized protein n=1 Tax=Lophiotrema nucula TaxID=690887 RepID=A0A6A5ZMD9_9PLEO|nr:hypothetical protein BDV96DRAFT_349956 [Lophiotrema nucula]